MPAPPILPRPVPDPELLLAHGPYVRALARELVFDADLARDVEQEAWLAALENAPRDRGALRGWLAALVRNLAIKAWRASARRREREDACARPLSSVPTPEEILEREDLRRRLVDSVLALGEPYRSALVLRFFEELPPRAVASRLGLPVETARTRIKRGLELLRERLDRGSRGDRGAWCLALVRGLKVSASTAQMASVLVTSSSSGVVVMKLVKMLVLPAAAAALVATGVMLRSHREGGDRGVRIEPGDRRVALDAAERAASSPVAQALPQALASPPGSAPSGGRTAVAAPRSSSQESVVAGGSVLLRTSWHDGTPAAGVAATVHWSAAEDFYADAFEVRTGPDGTAHIEPLPPCRVGVYLDRGPVGSVESVAGEQVEVALAIPRQFDVEGIVVDVDGQPLPGAEIFLDHMGSGWNGYVVGHSGADGRFHVRSIAEGLCWLSARAPLRAPTARYVLVSGSGATLEVELAFTALGGALEGTVRDGAGQGVAHAQVLVGDERAFVAVAVPGGGEAVSPAAQRVIADDQGRFRVAGVAAGSQPVRIRARDSAPWIGEVEVISGQTAGLNATVLGEARVEGTVTGAAGEPVPGAEIYSGDGDYLDRVTRSRADGTFSLRGLPDGAFELRVESEGKGAARTTLVGTPGAILHWAPVLGGLRLGGRIEAPGIDPSRWVIRCEALEPAEGGYLRVLYMGDARPDAQGAFEFNGVPDGSYRIDVIASDMGPGAYCFPVAVVDGLRPGGPDLVIDVDPARWPSIRLRGRVLDAQGQPLAGVPLCPGWEGGRGNAPLLATEPDGTFDIGPYPPGRWKVIVRPRGLAELSTETVQLSPDQTRDFGDLVVE